MDFFGLSDIGKKRKDNEDSFSVREITGGAVLLTVCDGMGGANGGREASSSALGAYTDYFARKYRSLLKGSSSGILRIMKDASCSANRAVRRKSKEDESLSGMGTTLVSAFLTENALYAVNVGDSRLYLLRGGKLERISHDHSYVQMLIDSGAITEEEALTNPKRNIITRAVGTDKNLETDGFAVEFDKEGGEGKISVLLCSDGLTNAVTEEKITEVLSRDASCEERAKELVAAANEGGGPDNVTVIVADL